MTCLAYAKRRDMVLFGEEIDWKESVGGIMGFKGLTIKQLEELEEVGFLDPSDRQNDSPEPGSSCGLCGGYATSPYREDYRIALEGIELKGGYSVYTKSDFLELCCNSERGINRRR